MARNLYRIYLYVVSIGLLVLAAVGAYLLLDAVLGLTALRGSYRGSPPSTEVTQRAVFAVVAWAVAGGLGGLHYWLIRRDMASDSTAGGSAIRAFFLNATEAVAVLIAVFTAIGAFSTLAFQAPDNGRPDVTGPLAATLTALGVAALVEWERRRAQAAPGVATVFQRVHLYGVPLLLVVAAATPAWQEVLRESSAALLYRLGLYSPACVTPVEPVGPGQPAQPFCYPPQDIRYLWASVLTVTVAWVAYAWLTRGDTRSYIRTVLHLLGFGYGLAFVVYGIDRVVALGLRPLFQLPVSWSHVVSPFDAAYNFISPLGFGLVVALTYGLWLRHEAGQLPLGAVTTRLLAEAEAAVILAVPFWWGVGYVLRNAVERLAPATSHPTAEAWTTSLALLIAGVGYIPLALHVRRDSRQSGISGPHRGMVFALLAGGAITGAVGVSIALYAMGTALLGAPLNNWQATARTGAVAFVVGAIIAALYVLEGMREHYFGARPERGAEVSLPSAREAAGPAAPQAPASVEAVLDQFAQGALTRAQAAERIRELTNSRA